MTEHTALDRLRVLVDAGIALSSELSLEALLQQLVERAALLTGARYAALGVIDQSGTGLERFLTTGIDAETRAAIGELPKGRGILGVLIREAVPLRLAELGDDARSVGFPDNHPPMRTFLGVPILLRGVAYGNLYLTEKQDGAEFTEDDEELVQLLAAQAAVAIENTRLYETSTRWLHHLESLNEIGGALAGELELEPLLGLVARRLRDLVQARMVLIALPEPGTDRLRIAAADGEGTDAYGLMGMELELGRSKTGRVLQRGRSERVDSVIDDPEIDQQIARRMGVRSALYVPLVVHDKLGPTSSFGDDDLRLAESLAARAAIAVELSKRVSRDTVRRVVEAQENERARLARELHDETGQALTSILLGLKSLDARVNTAESRVAVAELRELVVSTLQDVRRLAVELRPAALDDFGLVPAIERLRDLTGEQSGVSFDLVSEIGDQRLSPETETTLYRIAQEALTNVLKHANAHHVRMRLSRSGKAVKLVVQDDGSGFDPERAGDGGVGIVGMGERVALVGGRLTIESTEGAGTMLTAVVPIQ
jgi:signal transduction histidine kinase